MKKIISLILGLVMLLASVSASAMGNRHFLMMPAEDAYGWTLDDVNSSGSQYRRATFGGCGYRCVLEYEFTIDEADEEVDYNLVAIYSETRNGASTSGIIGEYFLQKNAAGWGIKIRHTNNTTTTVSSVNVGETYEVRIEVNFETNTQDIFVRSSLTGEEASLTGLQFKEPAQGTDTAFQTLRLLAGWAYWDDDVQRVSVPEVKVIREAAFVKQAPVITFENNKVKAKVDTYNNGYSAGTGPTLVLCLYDRNGSLVSAAAKRPSYESRTGSATTKPELQSVEIELDYKLLDGMTASATVINGFAQTLPFITSTEVTYNE